jgi:DNA-binding HxlR family transcriptional regulator
MAREHTRPCAVAAALDIIGEKWSLLVVREVALGVHRFGEIVRNTGAPRDILTARLRTLEAAGVLERRLYQERPERYEYRLTAAGKELRPILLALSQWGERHTGQPPVAQWVHECGEVLDLVPTCRHCGGVVTGSDVRARYLDEDWNTAA